MASQPEIRLTLKLWEVGLIILTAILGAASNHDGGFGLLCGIVAGASFGIWRCVRLLGQLLELKQSEIFDEDGH